MNLIKFCITVFFAGLFALHSRSLVFAAAEPQSEDGSPGVAVITQSLQRLAEGVKKTKLSNGLRVLFYRRKQAPVFTGQIWVKVGGVNETPGNTGVSHMLEHMAFKGTKKIGSTNYSTEKKLLDQLEHVVSQLEPGQKIEDSEQGSEIKEKLAPLWVEEEFSREYKRKGAVGLNAGTSNDYTYYTVALPKVAFELWCWMESDRLLDPVFRQFYAEREVVIEERRSRIDDDPGGKLYEALIATSFLSHPNRLPIIGWPSDLKNLTATRVRNLHQTYYRPDNMVLALVGDLEFDEVLPLLERYFGRIPANEAPLPKITVTEEPQVGERNVTIEFDAEPRLMLAYHKPTYPSLDDAHLTLMHELLAGSHSSILYKELVQVRQLATYVYTSEAPGQLYPPIFLIGGNPVQGVSNDRLRDEIQNILDLIKKRGVTEEQLNGAKRRVHVGLLSGLMSNSGLARTLAQNELLWGDWKILLRLYENVLATTSEDVRQVTRKYFTKRNRTYAHLEKMAKGKE